MSGCCFKKLFVILTNSRSFFCLEVVFTLVWVKFVIRFIILFLLLTAVVSLGSKEIAYSTFVYNYSKGIFLVEYGKLK